MSGDDWFVLLVLAGSLVLWLFVSPRMGVGWGPRTGCQLGTRKHTREDGHTTPDEGTP